MGAKSWIYKGINLKTEAKIMGIEANEQFVEFKPNANVAPGKFNPPGGVEYENISAKQQDDLSGIMSAFVEMNDMYEEEDEEVIFPVKYDFEDFQQVIERCDLNGFKSLGTANSEGMYVATFMKGMQVVVVTLQADRNLDAEHAEYESFRPFTHHGRNCRYGELSEEDGTLFLVEYPSQSMVVLIVAMPGMSKDEMIKMEDKLQF